MGKKKKEATVTPIRQEDTRGEEMCGECDVADSTDDIGQMTFSDAMFEGDHYLAHARQNYDTMNHRHAQDLEEAAEDEAAFDVNSRMAQLFYQKAALLK